jgi:hypothetical protein
MTAMEGVYDRYSRHIRKTGNAQSLTVTSVIKPLVTDMAVEMVGKLSPAVEP